MAMILELIDRYATKDMMPQEPKIDCFLTIDALRVTPMKIMDICRPLKLRNNKTLTAFQTQIAFDLQLLKNKEMLKHN